MKHNFYVKRWPHELALEEVKTKVVSFWVQIRGVALYLNSEENFRHLATKNREF